MSIFLFIKNKYNRIKYNRVQNKPILEKALKIKNNSFKLSKALDNLDVINYVGNDGLVYGIINHEKFIFNCDFSIPCNENNISPDDYFTIFSNRLQTGINIYDYEKDPFTKAIMGKIPNEKIDLMDIFLFTDNKLKESMDDFIDIKNIGSSFKIKYDTEKEVFFCSSTFKIKPYIERSYVSIELMLRIFDNDHHQVNIIFYNGEKKSIVIKKTDDVKEMICIAIAPYLLTKEGCDLLGINSVDEFNEDLYNNLKLLCY